MMPQTLYQTRRSINSTAQMEQEELLNLCQQTFVAYKYGKQLKDKADRIIKKIEEYQLQINDIETMPIVAEFAFDKQDLELKIIGTDLSRLFLERESIDLPNKEQVQNRLYINLQYVKEKLGQIQNDYTNWAEKHYSLTNINKGGIDISLFLKLNVEETSQQCYRKAEELRQRMVKETKILDSTQIQGESMPFKIFRMQYEFYFPKIAIERQIQTETLFLQSIIQINEQYPAENQNDLQQNIFYHGHNVYKINGSANTGQKQLLIPKYILQIVKEQNAHKKLFELMIQENIDRLNHQGEEQILLAIRSQSRIRPRPQQMQMPNPYLQFPPHPPGQWNQ